MLQDPVLHKTILVGLEVHWEVSASLSVFCKIAFYFRPIYQSKGFTKVLEKAEEKKHGMVLPSSKSHEANQTLNPRVGNSAALPLSTRVFGNDVEFKSFLAKSEQLFNVLKHANILFSAWYIGFIAVGIGMLIVGTLIGVSYSSLLFFGCCPGSIFGWTISSSTSRFKKVFFIAILFLPNILAHLAY